MKDILFVIQDILFVIFDLLDMIFFVQNIWFFVQYIWFYFGQYGNTFWIPPHPLTGIQNASRVNVRIANYSDVNGQYNPTVGGGRVSSKCKTFCISDLNRPSIVRAGIARIPGTTHNVISVYYFQKQSYNRCINEFRFLALNNQYLVLSKMYLVFCI